MNTYRGFSSKLTIGVGTAALASALFIGFGPAQATPPADHGKPTTDPTAVVKAPCSITSKVIALGHNRWMVRARLYRAGKRYPRHALSLKTYAADGTTVISESPKVGTKKAKWNWRMKGLTVAGETVQAIYAGDDRTEACEGAILTPPVRIKPTPTPTPTATATATTPAP